MKLILAVAIGLLLSAPAHAQQQQTPMGQALGQKVLVELNASLQCNAARVTLQAYSDPSPCQRLPQRRPLGARRL
jgi:hypothetical protein